MASRRAHLNHFLLFDPTGESCQVAVVGDTTVYRQATVRSGRLSVRLLAATDRVLTGAGIKPESLTGIGFVTGPESVTSFTSLRITAAVANALAYAHSIPLVPVATADAVTLQRFAAATSVAYANGQTVPKIIPEYGKPPTITPPRGVIR